MKRNQILLGGLVFGLSLFLGVSAVQAADVIFEPGTNRAIGVENLEVDGKNYTAEFRTESYAYQV